ncbi:cyclin-dependent kinase inhibitor 4-like isoform X1 [Cicer arietinum]|uniref:cyclin-dependent kinase inhibitor 4-like isoform X1 n=1 Tax=Cicer arietinum TaxID=3827 RepID=UPI00032A718C
MGKYMKKAKPKGELTLVDSTTTITTTATTTTYCGVRTRAKTLALQKQDLSPSSDSYLVLRSRRLQKPPISQHPSKRNKVQNQNPKSPIANSNDKEKMLKQNPDAEDASFGENVLDFEGRESRSTRESTPCNLIMKPDAVRTPSSTTKRTLSTEAYRRTEHATRTVIPSTREFDEFFAKSEEAQRRQFMEKYNFDPVTEKPLPGRYEWEKLTP